MPISIQADIRRPSQSEFATLAYDVMACIFQVHNEIGRFCDEKIFKRLVAKRFGNTETEVPIAVSFDTFSKPYCLDIHLYESAISHIFGGEDAVLQDIEINVDGVKIGNQKVRLTSSRAIFKVTTLYGNEHLFEQHARRFLDHTLVPAVHWVNVARNRVVLKTLMRQQS